MTNQISEERLRNTRAWAASRVGTLSGAEVIVGAIDELLARRELSKITDAVDADVLARLASEPRSEHTCEGTCDTPRLCRVSQECLFVRYVKNRPATAPDCTSNGSQALCSAWPTCRCGRAGAEHVKALKLIRDGAIPQGMSAALFADCVLGVPPENRPAGTK